MFSIFRRELVSSEEADWLFDVYRWLLRNLGGWNDFATQPLVLPNDEFFPVSRALSGHALAEALFSRVREHARLSEWPVVLAPHGDGARVRSLMPGVPYQEQSSGAAGSFAVNERGQVVITYSPSLLHDASALIATMSHELAHYLMHTVEEPPPGGPDAEEHATDVCCAFIGFGVFAANAAFSFSQFQDGNTMGWQASRQGYLDQRMLAYSLAIFLESRGLDESVALPHLTTNPRSYLRSALRSIRKHRRSDLSSLREISEPASDAR